MATSPESTFQLTQSDIIGIIGAVATIVVGTLSWLLSAYIAKKQMRNEELSYRVRITPLLNKKLFKDEERLEITYKGDVIDRLVFFELDIVNSGNVAVKNPPIRITSLDATYIIPAYLEDVPSGYDALWWIEREDGETCLIVADHINPGQTIKARFLMDNMPSQEPKFSCAVPDLKVRRIADIQVSPVATIILEAFYPSLARAVRALTRA